MANITGLITINGKQILEVDAVPSASAGTAAPLGSLAMYDTGAAGSLYIKAAAADTGWTLVDTNASDWALTGNTLTGAGPTTPTEFFGSNNDYDLVFKRNTTEEMRVLTSAILIGLSATLGGRLQVNDATDGADLIKSVLNATSNPVVEVNRMFRKTTVSNATSTFDIAIPTNTTVLINTSVQGRQTAGSTGAAGDSISYQRTLTANNIAGTVLKLAEQNDYTYEIAAAFDLTSAVSTTNIRYTIAGVTNRNVSWGISTKLLITGT